MCVVGADEGGGDGRGGEGSGTPGVRNRCPEVLVTCTGEPEPRWAEASGPGAQAGSNCWKVKTFGFACRQVWVGQETDILKEACKCHLGEFCSSLLRIFWLEPQSLRKN